MLTIKPSILLLAAVATLGLFAAACGAGQNSSETTVSSAVTAAPATTAATSPTTAASAPATAATSPTAVTAAPATTATTSPPAAAQPGSEPSAAGDTEFGFEEPCFAKQLDNPVAAQQQAEALLSELKTLFPALSDEQAGNLAFPYVQCGVTADDVKAVLAEGALGDQYRRMVEALKAESFRAFTEIYLAQPCLVGAHDLGANIQSATKLKDLVSAVSGAAFIQFEPDQAEAEAVAQGLMTDMMNSFQNALGGGSEPGVPSADTQPVTCEQFAARVS